MTEKRGPFVLHYRTREDGAVTFVVDRSAGLRVGWAFCAPQDAFSRRRGRTIAAGRCEALDGRFAGVEDNFELCDQLVEAMADERRQFEQIECGDGTVDPEPRIPRWFPQFERSWSAADR